MGWSSIRRQHAQGRGRQGAGVAMLVVLALALILTGCGFLGARAGTSDESKLEDADSVAIYAQIIRRLATEDDTFGGSLNPRTLYVIRATDDAAGDPMSGQSESVLLSETAQTAITEALSDLPAEIVWVDSRDEVPLDEERHAVIEGGAVITVGNVHPQEDGTVHVAGSIWIAMLAAGGQTYVLEQIDGAWMITGTTGVMWIS
jgi:hypothetical protein